MRKKIVLEQLRRLLSVHDFDKKNIYIIKYYIFVIYKNNSIACVARSVSIMIYCDRTHLGCTPPHQTRTIAYRLWRISAGPRSFHVRVEM